MTVWANRRLGVHVDRRGFKHAHPVPSGYGGAVVASESSSVEGPHIWVRVQCPSDLNDDASELIEAVAHLSLHNAKILRDQLTYLIENHFYRRLAAVDE